MTLEWAIFCAVLAVVALAAWRETRIRRTSKLAKSHKLLAKRLDRLEAELSRALDVEDLAEIERRVVEIEKTSPQAGFKALVVRVNDVSLDANALKILVEELKNRLVRLETGSTWSKIVKKEV